MSKKWDAVDAAFAGFVTTAGVGMFTLPIAVFSNVPPAIWGSLAIGAMPLGAVVGLAIWWANEPDDEEEPSRPSRPFSREPAIEYDPSRWTGRHSTVPRLESQKETGA